MRSKKLCDSSVVTKVISGIIGTWTKDCLTAASGPGTFLLYQWDYCPQLSPIYNNSGAWIPFPLSLVNPKPSLCYMCYWNNLRIKILCSKFFCLVHVCLVIILSLMSIFILVLSSQVFLSNILTDARAGVVEAAVCYVVSNDIWQSSSLIRNRIYAWFKSSSYNSPTGEVSVVTIWNILYKA